MKILIKKKRFLFPLIFLGELTVIITVVSIFNLETHNSFFALISVYTLFSTLAYFLIRIRRDHKEELYAIKLPFFLSSSASGFVLFVTIILVGLLIGMLPFALFDLLRNV